ncbi:MAG: arnC [Actinomycetia bacterium]|nr:arnC [Actinomycetes bacterium]
MSTVRPEHADATDPVELDAMARFAERYGAPDLGPVTVVMAAYREAASIGAVLREIPRAPGAAALTTLVIDDGSDDDTADIAAAAGAYVCSTVNRGQGAALRLGYRLAVMHGAQILVSIDADGQYDPAEIPSLVEPILLDRADFVSGSRRLGRNEAGDRFRDLGVTLYAWVMRLLTGQRITDPSFGLRAMRADVASTVPLRQPQFQAAELLVGAALRGYRVAEVPGVMRRRSAGESRKGPNLIYGARFGWVLVSTWWRTRRKST